MDEQRAPVSSAGRGRFVTGVLIVAAGVALLLGALGVEIPWATVLPAAVIVIGLALLALSRSGSARGFIAVGAVLTALLLLSLVSDQPLGIRSADTTESADFSVSEPIDRVVIEVDAGSVEIVGGSSGIEVERTLNYDGERPEVNHRVADGVLTITADCPSGFASLGSSCWVDHRLSLPESMDIEVDTGSGSVEIEEITGELAVDSGSGAIRLVGVTGRVTAKTGSGGVQLDDVGGRANIDTGSGTIRGDGLRSEEFEASAGSGSLDLAFETAPQRIVLTTGSGSVRLSVPAGRYNLDLDTNSGSVESPGIIDDAAASSTIEVSAGSGSIRVAGE